MELPKAFLRIPLFAVVSTPDFRQEDQADASGQEQKT